MSLKKIDNKNFNFKKYTKIISKLLEILILIDGNRFLMNEIKLLLTRNPALTKVI